MTAYTWNDHTYDVVVVGAGGEKAPAFAPRSAARKLASRQPASRKSSPRVPIL
jgi:hypothetical protein